MRWNPLRITEPWAKLAYIAIGWFGIPGGFRALAAFLGAPELLATFVDVGWGFVVVIVGSRSFRAREEDVLPPRVWWRATGRAPAGFWLGGLFVLGTLSWLAPEQPAGVADVWLYGVSGVLTSTFYLHSSIRLARGDAPVPRRHPKPPDDSRLIRPDRRLL